MHGKEFNIKPKSAIKKDKATARLDKLEVLLSDIIEKEKIVQSQKTRVLRAISAEKRIIKDNS